MTLASATNDTSALFQVILEQSLKAVGGKRGFIALVDLDSGQLIIRHTAGEGWDKDKVARFEKYTIYRRRITSASFLHIISSSIHRGTGR